MALRAFRTAPGPVTITNVPDTLLREVEPRLVDNPFRRESHRPWYARRGPRWVVGIAVVLLLGLNAFAFKEVSNRADPVSVDTAVARYRATAAYVAADTIPSTTEVGAVAAERSTAGAGQPSAPTKSAGTAGEVGVGRGPTPAPGVYVYDTSGFERVSALGGAQHDYPEQSTITITDNDCGIDMKWAPLEQRFDRWSTCVMGSEISMTSMTAHHEFFGQTEERTFVCQGADVRPPSDAIGTATSGTCTLAPDTVQSTVTVVGLEQVVVQGTAVDAVRVHLDQYMSGESNGSNIVDTWLRASDGLLLRYDAVADADAKTVIGPTHFHEEAHLTITDLAPLR